MFTTVIASDSTQAQDTFCRRYGYRDLQHFCQANMHTTSPLQVVVVHEPRQRPSSQSEHLLHTQARISELETALALVVERDFTYFGKEANTQSPDSLYNAVHNGRAVLARHKKKTAAGV